MDARARKPARETPTTGSIAYLYPGLPACSPQSRARRALGRVTASPRPPLPSEPRGASRVRALPASATDAARRGPRARRAVRRDVPCVPRPSTQPEPVPFESPASSLRADGVRRVAFWRLRRARLTRAQATFLKVPKNVPPDGVGKIRPSFGGPRCRRISNLLRIPRAIKIAISARSSSRENRSSRVFSHANEKRQQRKSLTHARLEIANENPPFPRERFRNRFSPHPTVKRPSFRSATRSSRSGTCRGWANQKSAGPVANPAHRPVPPVPRVSPDRARLAARSRPPAAPARTHAVARAPPRLPRRVAPRASLVAVGRNRHLLPYRSRERSRGARRDEHRVRVRDGGGQGPPHGEVLDGLRGLEGASHDARGTARTTTERSSGKEKASLSVGGVGVRRSFFSRARRGAAFLFFFFFFSRLARGPNERRRYTYPKKTNAHDDR